MGLFTEHLEEEIYDLKKNNKELEFLLLSYRQKLKDLLYAEKIQEVISYGSFKVMVLESYDKHFNITCSREGKI